MSELDHKVFKAETASVLADMGMVVGKAMIFTEKGEAHYDLQGDHIPKEVGVPATFDFAINSRTHKIMHDGEAVGQFAFLFPIVAETCKALDIAAEWEGIAIGFCPDADVLAKFISGEFRGFSIGGECSYIEEAE